jgi:hypothetical protein
VVVDVDVVVVVDSQLGPVPGGGQASQQLAHVPGVPCLAAQCAASFLILHFVLPVAVVKQQVTAVGFPQVERAAHLLTALAQLLFWRTAFACCAAQLTYAPWLVTSLQSQFLATAARAVATSDLSGSTVGSHFAWPGTDPASRTPSVAAAVNDRFMNPPAAPSGAPGTGPRSG